MFTIFLICICFICLKTFFCIFIKTLALWKKDVSIAAMLYMAVVIRNSVPTNAETITTTA